MPNACIYINVCDYISIYILPSNLKYLNVYIGISKFKYEPCKNILLSKLIKRSHFRWLHLIKQSTLEKTADE